MTELDSHNKVLEEILKGTGIRVIDISDKYMSSMHFCRTILFTLDEAVILEIVLKNNINLLSIINYAIRLKELVKAPLDDILLMMYDNRYLLLKNTIKNILQNGKLKHIGSKPLDHITIIY